MNARLYRSRRERMIAGVAGGLAELWGTDPSLLRIVWALLVILTGGLALVVYIVMAIVVPEEDGLPRPVAPAPEGAAPGWQPPPARSAGAGSGTVIIGAILVILGLFFLAREYLPDVDFDWFWPAMLIALGVLMVIMAVGRRPGRPGDGS